MGAGRAAATAPPFPGASGAVIREQLPTPKAAAGSRAPARSHKRPASEMAYKRPASGGERGVREQGRAEVWDAPTAGCLCARLLTSL